MTGLLDDHVEPVKPLRWTDRLALTSYEIRFKSDGEVQEVLGILPMLWQWVVDVIDHAAYDFGITLNIISDDHPNLRWLLGREGKRW